MTNSTLREAQDSTTLMKCAFCSFEFEEKLVNRSCGGCLKVGSCSMVKCPRCGYETPPEPEWLKRIKKKLQRGVAR